MAKRKSTFEKLLLLAVKEAVKASRKQAQASARTLPTSLSEEDYYITAGEINFLEPPDEYIELRTYSDTYTYPVSGESHQKATFLEIARNFPGQEEVHVEVLLVPFPKNPVDKFAVAVTYENMMLGYIPRYVSKKFSEFLGNDCGTCRARIYFDRPTYVRCSVELNVAFPPTLITEEIPRGVPSLISNFPQFESKLVKTQGIKLTKILLNAGESISGTAYLNEGFSASPWVEDCATGETIGKPREEYRWAMNMLCRAHGGQVKVQYVLQRDSKGNLILQLDRNAIPEMFKSKSI